MAAGVVQLDSAIDRAVARRQLLESAATNIRSLLSGSSSDLYLASITELAQAGAWGELNDRFFKTLAFGTGGLRGRTIGKTVTAAERGNAGKDERPQLPCVGTNAMNFYNVNRATQGLVGYLRDWLDRQQIPGKPKIVIAHDTRFFSEEFAKLTAKVASAKGCDAFIFDGPRSTPELSFAVRHLNASSGIVITASHNPPHDNGYKVYFSDGGQVIEPHADGIIAKVNATGSEAAGAQDRPGEITTIGPEVDQAYMRRLETLVLDPHLVQSGKSL